MRETISSTSALQKLGLRESIQLSYLPDFSEDTAIRGTVLTPWDRSQGIEWKVVRSHSGSVSEGIHLQMIPEPERVLNVQEEAVLLMAAKDYAGRISGRHRVGMNGPDTTLHTDAIPHAQIIFPMGYDRMVRQSANVQAVLRAADMPQPTRERLEFTLLQRPRALR